MNPLNEYNSITILSEEIFSEVFEDEDEIHRARVILSLRDRAKELGVVKKFDSLIKAYSKAEKENRKSSLVQSQQNQRSTAFISDRYENIFCGSWFADERGIRTYNVMGMEQIACYHPILPIKRLKNLQTGEEHLTIAYKRNGIWRELTVQKDVVSSANKIVALSKYGIAVTSETAKYLVKYLADVENRNDDYIEVQDSTSKLGWHGAEFVPYDTNIVFDGDSRFKSLFESVRQGGSEKIWLDHARDIRKTGRIEAKFMLAASFASALIRLVGGLPFFVDLWGETEGGKTVTLMLAASVWGDPSESQYIGDFKTTDTALEAKADMLNNLPVILDDTSKTSRRISENFEGIVYDLCSGKGKSRSNKELGINRENRWQTCFLTNGERPLSEYVSQGGAINRILEVECSENVYQDPQLTAETLKNNYGFAGQKFIEIVKTIGNESIKEIYKNFCAKLSNVEKMQKQIDSLAMVLTADQIATEYIFKDGANISLDDAKTALVDRSTLSDNQRCYEYLLDKIAMNQNRFNLNSNIELWGILENGYAVFHNQAFKDLCKEGGFSQKSFLSWAKRNKLILAGNDGRTARLKKFDGKPLRCIFLKLTDEFETDENGFMQVDEQEKLPFD